MKDLSGKAVLVTGATGGLGQALVAELLHTGARLVLTGRNQEALAKLAAGHPNVSTYAVNLGNARDRQVFLEEIAHRNIDVVINNAGYGVFENFEDTSLVTIEDMFQVNVQALIAVTHAVLPGMKSRGRGHIINIGSMAGKVATAKSSIYAATKFAVVGFSNALRLELAGSGVHVTTINPGPIVTPFHANNGDYLQKVGRIALKPEDLARDIVQIIGTNKRELNRPRLMAVGSWFYNLAPDLADAISSRFFDLK
jgi:short-subunit dehydrogenase